MGETAPLLQQGTAGAAAAGLVAATPGNSGGDIGIGGVGNTAAAL